MVPFLFFNDVFEYFGVFFLPLGLGNSDTTLCVSHHLVLDATSEGCFNTCLSNRGSPLGALKQTPPRDINGRKKSIRDFPGSLVIKTLPSKARSIGSVPGWGAKIPHASWPKNQKKKKQKTQNRNSIVTNSIKTLKMVHSKKKKNHNKKIDPLNFRILDSLRA